MLRAPILFAGLVCLAMTAGAQAQDARRPGEHYFVDFRARAGGVLGHTFVAYGRADGRGRVIEERHAGLYPNDEYGESPLLGFMLVPGYVTLKREDPSKPILAVYRKRLSAADYRHLTVTIRRLHATQGLWNMTFYNCNDFVGQVAREMGMVAPLAWALPNSYVRGLRALNGP